MKMVLILAALVALGYYGVWPLIPSETCPACEGRSAVANQAGSRAMNQMGVQSDPPVKCSYCRNTGKMTPRERKDLLSRLEEIERNQETPKP
jgi:hypothetical protein